MTAVNYLSERAARSAGVSMASKTTRVIIDAVVTFCARWVAREARGHGEAGGQLVMVKTLP